MRRFGVLLVVLLLAAVPASAQRLLGTIGNPGTGATTSALVELDPATGALVATIGDVGYLVNGMTWDEASGTLWATTSTNDATFPNGLITIDPATAAGTPVGTGAGQFVNVPASNSAGQVYGWTEASDDAVLWDTAAGTITVLGESGVGTLRQGLAFNAADELILINGNTNVYTIDTTTGAGTMVGTLGVVAHHGDFEPNSGLYYGIDAGGGGPKNLVVADLSSFTVVDTIPTVDDLHTLTFVPATRLFGTTGNGATASTSTLVEINPATGELIATIGDVGYLVNGLTWDARSRTLYATTSTNDGSFPDGLITIDLMTAAGTPVGTGAGFGAVVCAASNSAGQVYAWWDPSEDDLVVFDTLTGLATPVGESGIGTGGQGLAFNPDDVLYLVQYGGDTYTIDTTTGAATFVGTIGIPSTAHHGDFEPKSGLYYGIDVPGSGTKNLVVADLASLTLVNTIPTIDDLHTLTFIDTTDTASALEFDPGFLESRLYPGGSENQALSVLNYGRTDANVFLLALQRTAWVPMGAVAAMAPLRVPDSAASQLLTNLSGVAVDAPVQLGQPLAAGDVFQSWPSGVIAPWGTGFAQYTQNPWASSISLGGGDDLDYEYTSAGTPTGKTIDTSPWNINGYAADMAFNANTGMLWQMNVNIGDQFFMELDPVTGTSTGNVITVTGPATWYTALAYDPVTDTYFFGGWNDGMVFRTDASGAILQSASTGLSISGLAYNPVSEHLFVMTNASPNLVHVLDVADSYNLIGSFAVPGFGDFAGAGLAFSCDGHLWAVNQGDGMVYEFDSGETSACLGGVSLPWLVLTPNEGLVPADGMGPGALAINAEFIADGTPRYGLVQANIKLLHTTEGDVEDAQACLTKSFYDMTPTSFADAHVHSVAGAGITTGCGGGDFCPASTMTRGVMARWLLLSKYGPGYGPPPCTGIFGDVFCESTANAGYIEALYNEGITAGCSADPLLYCPDNPVTRAQMAVFLLKTLEGSGYVPPSCVGIFGDVSCPGYWAVDWIEEFYARGITAGCSATPLLYCPDRSTTRSEMAVFVQKTFQTPMCGGDN